MDPPRKKPSITYSRKDKQLYGNPSATSSMFERAATQEIIDDQANRWRGQQADILLLKQHFEGLTQDQAQQELDDELALEEEQEDESEAGAGEAEVEKTEDPLAIYDIPLSQSPEPRAVVVEDEDGAKLPAHIQRLADSLRDGADGLSKINSDRDRWLYEFTQNGYLAFLDAVLKDEQAMMGIIPEGKRQALLQIVATTDTPLLIAMMEGNVALLRKTSPSMRTTLRKIRERAAKGPGIYLQLLVDRATKESPTPNEVRKALVLMQEYCELTNDDEAYEIERLFHPRSADLNRSRTKYRRYLRKAPKPTTKDGKKIIPPPIQDDSVSDACVTKTTMFIRALRKRLDDLPASKQDEPLAMPLSEVGYANNCVNRLVSHASHNSSNYIMNLMESCFVRLQALGEYRGKFFSMEQFIVYNIWKPEQGILAEIFFTRIAHGYVYNGGGFTHFPLGISNDSIITKNQDMDLWRERAYYVWHHSPLQANMARDSRVIKQAGARRIAEIEARAKAEEEELLTGPAAQARMAELRQELGQLPVSAMQNESDAIFRAGEAAQYQDILRQRARLHGLLEENRLIIETSEAIQRLRGEPVVLVPDSQESDDEL